MEFWRYYRIIRRRRWLILLGMALCVGVVAYYNWKTVPLWTGRTTVIEQEGMSSRAIPLYPERYLQLEPQARLSNLSGIASSQRVLQSARMTLEDLDLKLTADEILGRTNISPQRDTNILQIEVTLPNPEDAKIAADVIAAEFKKVYGEINNSALRESREFIEEQLETTRQEMVKAQDRLRKFKEESGMVMMEQQAATIVQQLAAVKAERSQSLSAQQAAEAAARRLEKEMAKLPDTYVVSESISRDPLWQSLTETLSKLEIEYARMTVAAPGQPARGPNHPDVISIKNQIADTRAKLQKMSEDYKSSVQTGKNPVRTDVLSQWVRNRVEAVAQQARQSAMNAFEAEAQAELEKLPADEAKLAELRAEVDAATQTYRLMRDKRDEARIKEEQAKNEVALRTLDSAVVFPVEQRKVLKLILALLLSPLLGVGVALLLHYADNTVKTVPEAERVLGVPVYSAVPGARAHSLARQNCPEIMNVSYQMLTSHLWIASQNQDVNAVVMVSAEPDVGRSVTASNLAVALTKEGARVILVDADLRQPSQHLIFGLDNKVGLTNLLSGTATLEDVLVPTRIQGLLVVPAGPIPENPIKLLRSPEMKEFADQVSEAADFVIYDTPAGVTFPDAVLVSAYVGHAVVVHAAGRVPRGSESEFKARLESVGVRILGAVLNKVRREDSSGFFHYRRSYEGITVPAISGGKKPLKSGRGGAA